MMQRFTPFIFEETFLFYNLVLAFNPLLMVNHFDFVRTHPAFFKQCFIPEVLLQIIDYPSDFVKAEGLMDHHCFLHVIGGQHILFYREKSLLSSGAVTVLIKKESLPALYCITSKK